MYSRYCGVLLLQMVPSPASKLLYSKRNSTNKFIFTLHEKIFDVWGRFFHISTLLSLILSTSFCPIAFLSPPLSLYPFPWFSGAPHVIQSVDSVCLHASQLLSCDWNIRQGGRGPWDAPALTLPLSAKFYHTRCLAPTHIRYAPQHQCILINDNMITSEWTVYII